MSPRLPSTTLTPNWPPMPLSSCTMGILAPPNAPAAADVMASVCAGVTARSARLQITADFILSPSGLVGVDLSWRRVAPCGNEVQ